MASTALTFPKCSALAPNPKWGFDSSAPLAGSTAFPASQGSNQSRFPTLKAQVAIENSTSSSVSTLAKSDALSSNGALDQSTGQVAMTSAEISAFMVEVSNLVKLVDSKDIVELELKKGECELLIRKKEALPQPQAVAAPSVMMPYPQPMLPAQPPVTQSAPPAPKSSAAPSAPALPPPKASSSLPAMKSPMAGTFYRCPGPGEPPFVKVGDKVKKGQVLCIIEAMKLMNEIEAEQSGTIVEIIAEDAQPVAADAPLFIIQA